MCRYHTSTCQTIVLAILRPTYTKKEGFCNADHICRCEGGLLVIEHVNKETWRDGKNVNKGTWRYDKGVIIVPGLK